MTPKEPPSRTGPTGDDKLRDVSVVVVAFRVEEIHSVGYEKLKNPDDPKLGAVINRMIHDRKADFISIRAVDL